MTKLEILETAVRYQSEWEQKLREPDRWNFKEEDIIPHPKDMIIDYETGNVEFKGPVTTEQRDAQDQAVALRPRFERKVRSLERKLASNPGDEILVARLADMRLALDQIRCVETLVENRAAKSGLTETHRDKKP